MRTSGNICATVFIAFALMLVLAACNSNGETTAETSGVLDGKTFTAEITEADKDGEATPDEITFVNGMFHSADCDQHGFETAPYKAKTDGDMILFTSTSTSPTEGKLDWRGLVAGSDIKGIFVWQKEGQDPITYEFSGKIKE